jgi:hypothetical protein
MRGRLQIPDQRPLGIRKPGLDFVPEPGWWGRTDLALHCCPTEGRCSPGRNEGPAGRACSRVQDGTIVASIPFQNEPQGEFGSSGPERPPPSRQPEFDPRGDRMKNARKSLTMNRTGEGPRGWYKLAQGWSQIQRESTRWVTFLQSLRGLSLRMKLDAEGYFQLFGV